CPGQRRKLIAVHTIVDGKDVTVAGQEHIATSNLFYSHYTAVTRLYSVCQAIINIIDHTIESATVAEKRLTCAIKCLSRAQMDVSRVAAIETLWNRIVVPVEKRTTRRKSKLSNLSWNWRYADAGPCC